MPRKRTVETHVFTKGQRLHLDEIYLLQGLAGGDWWTAADPGAPTRGIRKPEESGEDITITRDITIRIETW